MKAMPGTACFDPSVATRRLGGSTWWKVQDPFCGMGRLLKMAGRPQSFNPVECAKMMEAPVTRDNPMTAADILQMSG